VLKLNLTRCNRPLKKNPINEFLADFDLAHNLPVNQVNIDLSFLFSVKVN
jgi:hypothetical protein